LGHSASPWALLREIKSSPLRQVKFELLSRWLDVWGHLCSSHLPVFTK
jgi:hypothetical protein